MTVEELEAGSLPKNAVAPQDCPYCGFPCYAGFLNVECVNPDCKAFDPVISIKYLQLVHNVFDEDFTEEELEVALEELGAWGSD